MVHRAAKNAAQVPAALKAPAYALPIPFNVHLPLLLWSGEPASMKPLPTPPARFEEAVPSIPTGGEGIIFVPYKSAGT